MQRYRNPVTLAGLLWVALVVASCPIGCAPPPPEPGPSEPEHSPHKKTHPHHHAGGHASPHNHHEGNTGPARSGESTGAVSEKARTVLKYIDEHHEAPSGYEGGRAFHNAGGLGEQPLPRHDDRGRAITYQEWDVNPKVEGVNRGTERLITGSDGSAYVTADHYKTFTKLR